MYFTIYKITNLVNGMFYIGAHKTDNLDDGYMGSGTDLNKAYEKEGMQNFKKEILSMHETSEQMYETEKLIVTEEFVARPDTYNIKVGGDGGWDHCNTPEGVAYKKAGRLKSDQVILEKYGVTNPGQLPHVREINSAQAKERMKNKNDPFLVAGKTSFLGKKHSKETIEKLRLSQSSVDRTGSKNPSYGTIWITNGIENKKVKKNLPIPDGWNRGRTTK